jgi:C4-dicarboxylate-specific signal transduction histidine kinase
VVSVSDGGKVVAADCIARMFEPFSAVARRGVEPTMPTGLGLAIALEIAELHGGSLVFTSTEQGGLFSLRLPA